MQNHDIGVISVVRTMYRNYACWSDSFFTSTYISLF